MSGSARALDRNFGPRLGDGEGQENTEDAAPPFTEEAAHPPGAHDIANAVAGAVTIAAAMAGPLH